LIEINLIPFPAPRPRFSKYGTYNPEKYTEYKKAFALLAKRQCKTYLNGAIKLEVTFIMQIPKSLSKKKQSELIGQYHIKKPDTDNLVKTVKDSLNGVLYKDDSQISKVVATKIYGENPRALLELTEL
jgi:Holliday junction resolvase RusA-like endonuclease